MIDLNAKAGLPPAELLKARHPAVTDKPDMKGGEIMPTMKTIRRAAEETGLSYEYVRQLIRERKIVYVKAGVKFLVNMEKLKEYLNQGERN